VVNREVRKLESAAKSGMSPDAKKFTPQHQYRQKPVDSDAPGVSPMSDLSSLDAQWCVLEAAVLRMGVEFAAFLPLMRAAVHAVEEARTETFALLDAQALTPPRLSYSDLRENFLGEQKGGVSDAQGNGFESGDEGSRGGGGKYDACAELASSDGGFEMRLIVAWRRAARPVWASCVSFVHVAWVRLGGVLALIVYMSWMIAECALWLCRHLRKGVRAGRAHFVLGQDHASRRQTWHDPRL
jgi:hypothetical protein